MIDPTQYRRAVIHKVVTDIDVTTIITIIVGQTVFEHQVMPGWNTPQGVEIVHTVCAGKY